jgi:MFS family permease
MTPSLAVERGRRGRRRGGARGSGAFYAVWAAAAGGNLGDGLLKTTVPLFAVALTTSPGLVAGASFALTLPWALLALPVGALADRIDRRRLLIAASMTRCAALAVLAMAAMTDTAGLMALYVAAFVLGCCEVVVDTTAGALVPTLVGRERLEWANTRLIGTETVLNEFVGPPLGGALVALALAAALGAGAIAYLAAAIVLLLFLRGSFRPAAPARTRVSASIGAQMLEGLHYLWRQPALRALSLMTAVMAGAWSAWTAVLVLYVVDGPVGLGPAGYGMLLSMLAVGGLAGSLAAQTVVRAIGPRTVITADVLATITMLATPALTADAYAIAAATVIGGLGSGMWNVVVTSLRQRITPDELLGRITAAARLLGWGSLPLGAALGGTLAATLGVQAVFAIGAAASAAIALPLLRHLTPDALTTHPPKQASR